MNFDEKVVLITGANRGLGKELVIKLLDTKVTKIYACSRIALESGIFKDERVINKVLDITKIDSIKELKKQTSDIDVLINNAGVASYGSLLDCSIESLAKDMDTNYYGTLNMVREYVPILELKQNTAIVNVITIAAFVNFPAMGGYCASKSAAYSMTQAIRIELKPKGIMVHAVNPGPIDTQMADGFEADKTQAGDVASEILKGLESGLPDIFPDQNGRYLFDIFKKDHLELEQLVSEIHHSST